jgi:hypothetical protein
MMTVNYDIFIQHKEEAVDLIFKQPAMVSILNTYDKFYHKDITEILKVLLNEIKGDSGYFSINHIIICWKKTFMEHREKYLIKFGVEIE